MSAQSFKSRVTAPQITARKGGEPVVCLTAYDAPTAAIMDEHCDLILVGDSVGMVVHGCTDKPLCAVHIKRLSLLICRLVLMKIARKQPFAARRA